MATFLDIHPVDPQPRLIGRVVDTLRDGGLVAYPTDACYALGAQLGNQEAKERIIRIRQLDDKHHFTLVCADFAQLGQFVHLTNAVFRAVKAATPGPFTFILPASPGVPRKLQHPKKKTVGVRIPEHRITQAILAELGQKLVEYGVVGEREAAVAAAPPTTSACPNNIKCAVELLLTHQDPESMVYFESDGR